MSNTPNFATPTLIVPASGEVSFGIVGNYITNLQNNMTAGTLTISIGDGRFSRFDAGDTYLLPVGTSFEKITLNNTTGAPVTVQIGTATGEIKSSNAITVQGAVNISKPATLTTAADVAMVAGVATLIAAASSTTREVHISNLLVNNSVMRIGDAGVAAAEGAEVGIGETRIITTTAAIYGYFAGAGKSVGVLIVGD